jgi:hypothetical protein
MIAAIALAMAVADVPDPMNAVALVQTGSSVCAGAFVDDVGTIVTAYHCVAIGGRSRVRTRGGKWAKAEVLAVSVAADLAVLSARAHAGEPFLILAEEVPPPGEPVLALGHPFGAVEAFGFFEQTLRWSVSSGIISNVGPRAVQFTAPVNPGNSGGPVVNERGELVAVVSRRLAGDGMGFGAPVDSVRKVLTSGRRRSPVGGTLGLGVHGASWDGMTMAVGPSAELAFRDRVFFDGRVAVPLTPVHWQATLLGDAAWPQAEARGGLRQRMGSGRWTVRADAYGGIVSLGVLTLAEGVPRRSTLTVFEVGGQLSFRAVGLDFAWTPQGLRGGISLRWPGTISVF